MNQRIVLFAGLALIAAGCGRHAANPSGDVDMAGSSDQPGAADGGAGAGDDLLLACMPEADPMFAPPPSRATIPFLFQVVSDVHAHADAASNANIVTALNDLKTVGSAAALVLNGDLTEHGYATEYSGLTTAISGRTPAVTLLNIGNHEYHGSDSSAVELARYLAYTHLSSVYYDRTVGGYPFIFLGGENGDGDPGKLAWTAVLSDAQLNWLEQRLAAVADPRRPTFVFLHQGPMDTSNNARLKQILAAHPNVVYFWSHWHRDLHSPQYSSSMFTNADGFRLIHTAAVQYNWDISNAMHYDWAQGLQIEVFSDFLRVRGRDFTGHAWVAQFDLLHEWRAPLAIGAVAANSDGRLELAVASDQGDALDAAQATAGGAWPAPASRGFTAAGAPVIAANGDGRLAAFVRGSDGAIHTSVQASPGGAWGDWSSLGGTLNSRASVGRNSDGRLELFARGSDEALWHAWQNTPGGAWSAWQSLGGQITSDPVVAANSDGRLEVFARGSDGILYHMYQQTSGGWSAWAGLGGQLASNPAVARNRDGQLEVFALGVNGALAHLSQAASATGWSAWSDLGGNFASDPAVIARSDGRLDVYLRGSDGAVYHDVQDDGAMSGWAGWKSLGGAVSSTPVVAANGDGRVEVFARDATGVLVHAWQQSSDGCWSPWVSLAQPVAAY
jgi:hypothetical protein